MNSFEQAEALAKNLMSAAAQSPTEETLAVLQSIPEGAFKCFRDINADLDGYVAALMVDAGPKYASALLEKYGDDADPWSLAQYALDLKEQAGKPVVEAKAEKRSNGYTVEIDGDRVIVTGAPPAPTALPALPPFTDLSGFWDLADEEVPHLFGNSMPMGELSVIASEPGVGKTTLVIGLALSVAIGRGLVAGYTPRRRGKVALLLAEDGPIPTAKRLRGWCEAEGVSRGEVESAVAQGRVKILSGDSAQLLDFSTGICRRTAAYGELLAQCHAERWDLLVVDSLIEWTAPPSENDNAVVQQAAKALIDLARVTGGSVLALHHSNKASDKSGAIGLHAIRGGSSLAGKIRWGGMLSHLQDDEAKAFEIPQEDRWRYLRLDVVKSQYSARAGECVYLERGEGGIPHVVNLHTPSKEDEFAKLARALADKIGDNPNRWTKWQLIREKPGANLRAELKMYNDFATVKNLGIAYDLAVKNGLIVEENGTHEAGGQCSILPRKVEFDDAA